MKGPIATRVQNDMFGAVCHDCLTAVYIDRVDRGKPVYRHVERKPPCLFTAVGKPR